MAKAPKIPDYLKDGLYFIPLGGSEQFGVNLNVYVSGGQMLAVDCGIGFTGDRHPGIDLLLPDPAFLEKNIDALQALVITHAHEDHVGAVPYLWNRLDCPIYTTKFTAAVLEDKFRETPHKKVPITACKPGEVVKIGKFKVKFLPVSHSIPDTCSLEIETPEGRILHSGDWNLDPAPVAGYKTDAKVFKESGDKGIVAYIGDSTNSEVPGRSGTESEIEAGLAAEFKKCKGRIAVTIFSSNIGRIISIARAARKCGREVGVIGRSLHKMIGAARRCGYLTDIPEFLSEEDLAVMPEENVLMIVTGSQGEPRSALAKIARGEFRGVKLGKRDTVIFSARPIPGNESNINAVKNNLSAGGVRVITPSDTTNTIHVSGHPCRDEILEMYDWVRPQTVIPVHGERIQLEAQAALARQHGIKNVIVPNNGSVIRLAPGKPEVIDHVETGLLAVDQKRIISADHESIAERRKLQYSGTLHVALALDVRGELLGEPKVDAVGLLGEADGRIIEDLKEEIVEILEDMTWEERGDDKFVAEELRICLRRFMVHLLGMKPVTTVHVVRV
ncbi:MAG: ribonuclease J [Alphaproteobacteria bacterium]|nr:ribonuclease J [Alphaproteobacteria bacterium]